MEIFSFLEVMYMAKEIRIRVAGVMTENGKVLLVCHEKEGKHYWLLPGGGVDFGENLEEALKREFFEETSLKIKVAKLLVINETIAPDSSRHSLHFTFLVKKVSGKLKANPDERLKSARFVEWKKISKIPLRPDIASLLVDAYKKKFRISPVFIGNIWLPG